MAAIVNEPPAQTVPTMLKTPPPLHLKHKPIFMIPYETFDGPYDPTDCKYLSIGLAQWEEPGALSAKTFRWTGDKWSRQSEELPLHRVIDLTIFIVNTLMMGDNCYQMIPAGTFSGQTDDIQLNRMENIPEEFSDAKPLLEERLGVLKRLLDSMG